MSAADQSGQWRRISPDVIVGTIDSATEPGLREQCEDHHCLGITDTPCGVEIEGVGAERVGSDVVRRHRPGDRLAVTVGSHMRARWVLVSASLIDQPAPAFTRPTLRELAQVRRTLGHVTCSSDPMRAEEIALQAFADASGANVIVRSNPSQREAPCSYTTRSRFAFANLPRVSA